MTRAFKLPAARIRNMTEEEHIQLVEVGDEFWKKFSALCNEYVAKAPSGLEAVYETYLGEKTSMYGRDTNA